VFVSRRNKKRPPVKPPKAPIAQREVPPVDGSPPSPEDPSRTDAVERRFSARRKAEVVQRLMTGESLDVLSRELGLTASRIAEWRDAFLGAGQAALKSRETTTEQDDVRRLKSMLGDLTMRNELLHEKIRQMEAIHGPFGPRRSRP
jgi:transposase-like protein